MIMVKTKKEYNDKVITHTMESYYAPSDVAIELLHQLLRIDSDSVEFIRMLT